MLRRSDASVSIAFALSMLAAMDAAATAQRTFVASYGVATNTAFNCSIAKPCRQFSEATGVTSPKGEVIVLDSAGYGPVTITQSVSILAPAGVYAGISVFSGNGVTITTPAVTDKVVLHGLTINSQGTTGNGIEFSGAGTLEVARTRIAGFAGDYKSGLLFSPVAAGQGRLRVVDLSVSASYYGVLILGGSSVSDTVHAVLQRVDLTGATSYGLAVYDFANVVATDSTFTENDHGIETYTSSGEVLLIAIDRCSVSRNRIGMGTGGTTYAAITGSTIANNDGVGLSIGSGSEARLAGTAITQNLYGIVVFGVAQSQGNNFIYGNATDGPAPIVVGSK